jgi:hypothetical protein
MYNVTVAKQAWRGLSVELCHGHPKTKATLVEIFNQVRGLSWVERSTS